MRLKYGTELPRFATSALNTRKPKYSRLQLKVGTRMSDPGDSGDVDDFEYCVARQPPQRKETQRGVQYVKSRLLLAAHCRLVRFPNPLAT